MGNRSKEKLGQWKESGAGSRASRRNARLTMPAEDPITSILETSMRDVDYQREKHVALRRGKTETQAKRFKGSGKKEGGSLLKFGLTTAFIFGSLAYIGSDSEEKGNSDMEKPGVEKLASGVWEVKGVRVWTEDEGGGKKGLSIFLKGRVYKGIADVPFGTEIIGLNVSGGENGSDLEFKVLYSNEEYVTFVDKGYGLARDYSWK